MILGRAFWLAVGYSWQDLEIKQNKMGGEIFIVHKISLIFNKMESNLF